MSGSILTSVKKVCGLTEDYTVFDQDLILYINNAFSTLNQLGIGPVDGFEIEDASAMWSDYVTDPRLNSVKNYVILRTRLQFDPPSTGFLLAAQEKQIEELAWRLEVARIPVIPAAPISLPDEDIGGGSPDSDGLIYDGGSPGSDEDYDLIYDGGTP